MTFFVRGTDESSFDVLPPIFWNQRSSAVCAADLAHSHFGSSPTLKSSLLYRLSDQRCMFRYQRRDLKSINPLAVLPCLELYTLRTALFQCTRSQQNTFARASLWQSSAHWHYGPFKKVFSVGFCQASTMNSECAWSWTRNLKLSAVCNSISSYSILVMRPFSFWNIHPLTLCWPSLQCGK